MRTLKTVSCTAFLLLCLFPLGRGLAQNYSIGQAQLGIDFLVAVPQNEFRENSKDPGFGLSLDLGYVVPNMPVVAGITGGFATYGSETFKVPFSSTVQLVTVDLTTSNNIALGHLFLRFQPQTGVFRPYFEGLLGLHYFWTESTVEDERYEDKEIAGSTNLSDVAFSYGAGGGIMFRVYKGETNDPGKGIEVLVNARVRYLYGGEAKYFNEQSLTSAPNGAPILDERYAMQSETDMLNIALGVSVRF
jgi:hypothetical protein